MLKLKKKPENNKISSNFELSKFLNENISFENFLLINEKGENLGLIDKEKALKIAKESELDLFCITPHSQPAVCKILDFSKYSYKKKKGATTKKDKKRSLVKEAKFSFRISENDLDIKVKKIINWLSEDNLVKVMLSMWGREKKHSDLALEKCNKIIKKVQEKSSKFQLKDEIKLVGNMYIFMFFTSKKVANKND